MSIRVEGCLLKNAFPKDLANKVIERWDNLVVGEYTVPPRPPDRLFRQLLEAAYLASIAPDEGRFPKFNIVAVPRQDSSSQPKQLGQLWQFSESRKFSVDEIRKLAPAVDYKKSAIFVRWSSEGWEVAGLSDLGTSWSRARVGLQYHYQFPASLFVQVDRPGRIRVYQGKFLIAALEDGKIEQLGGFELSLVLHRTAHNGLRKISEEIKYPDIEEPREYYDFQFIAFWNVFAALANCVNEEGHGGALIIVPANRSTTDKELRLKYGLNSPVLREAFIGFMNARHRIADVIARIEGGEKSLRGEYAVAEVELNEKQLQLVEAIRFIARLSACDGAIVISEDLRLMGFGTEIRAELKSGTKAEQVIDDLRHVHRPLDVETFGLRHRSAIKLVSRRPNYCVLVISQDGGISFVWSEKSNSVCVKRGVNLINMNMPWG